MSSKKKKCVQQILKFQAPLIPLNAEHNSKEENCVIKLLPSPSLPMSVAASCISAAPPGGMDATKKRKRLPPAPPVVNQADCQPSGLERRRFWQNVKSENLQEVINFCATYPQLLAYWKEYEADLYAGVPGFAVVGDRPGPMFEYVGVGNDDFHCMKSASLAVLYVMGLTIPERYFLVFLKDVFSRYQEDEVLQRCMDKLKGKLDNAIKTNPVMLEIVLSAAALSSNLHMFQQFNPKIAKKTLYDVMPGRKPGDISLLHAILTWQDPKIRRDLFMEAMARSSTSYILLAQFDSGIGSDGTSSALEQAAGIPDLEIVKAILSRLKSDSVIGFHLPALVRAILHSVQSQCNSENKAADDTFCLVQTEIAAHLDELHLCKLHGKIEVVRANIIRCKVQSDPSKPLYAQAKGVLDTLARVAAASVSSVKYSEQLSFKHLIGTQPITAAEEAAFEKAYRSHLSQIDTDMSLRDENSALKMDIKTLRDRLDSQSTQLKALKIQAMTIASLRQQIDTMSGGGDDFGVVALPPPSPTTVDLEKRFLLLDAELKQAELNLIETLRNDPFIADMDFRLNMLKLPTPRASSSPQSKGMYFSDDQIDSKLKDLKASNPVACPEAISIPLPVLASSSSSSRSSRKCARTTASHTPLAAPM
jgi:hypothetical protein